MRRINEPACARLQQMPLTSRCLSDLPRISCRKWLVAFPARILGLTAIETKKMKMTLKESLGFTVLSLLLPCVLLGLQAGCKTNPPTAAELRLLQGYWESVPPAKNSITITGKSLHYYARTDFWYETTFTLPAGTDPQQLHATIKRCSYPDSIGKVVIAIFKIEDETLTLAYLQTGAAPKSFEDEEADRFKLRKVQPQRRIPTYLNPNELSGTSLYPHGVIWSSRTSDRLTRITESSIQPMALRSSLSTSQATLAVSLYSCPADTAPCCSERTVQSSEFWEDHEHLAEQSRCTEPRDGPLVSF